MVRKILNRFTDAVIWEGEAETIKEALHAALKAGANLSGADLSGANLSRANLSGADLSGANLSRANLSRADLSGADLSRANLSRADLSGADLSRADLSWANLSGANLSRANLSRADLSGADLSRANLSRADLSRADLSRAKDLRLPTGETWEEYLTETVPALLTAGGKELASFAEHWQCHDWTNCPIAHAFDAPAIENVPMLLRPRADQFIQFFDAKQIPWPLPTKVA